jgi:hypothetical protein
LHPLSQLASTVRHSFRMRPPPDIRVEGDVRVPSILRGRCRGCPTSRTGVVDLLEEVGD